MVGKLRMVPANDANTHPKFEQRSPGFLIAGLLFAGSAVVLALSSGFSPNAFVAPVSPASNVQASSVALAPGSHADRMDAPRSEAVPLTQMHGRYPDRSRKNMQGGGRLPIRVNRNPMLGYARAGENEPNARVIGRMFDMMDLQFGLMAQARQRYFRPEYRRKKWTKDWGMQAGRRRKELRLKREFDEEWAQWMRSFGRRQGLTEPIIYKGPIVKEDPNDPSIEETRKLLSVETFLTRKNVGKGWDQVPPEMQPGKWDDGPESVHKVYRRPLHTHPYDIGKRGTKNVVVGIVM